MTQEKAQKSRRDRGQHVAVIRCTSDNMETTKYFAVYFTDRAQMEDHLKVSNAYRAFSSNPTVMKEYSGLDAYAVADITFAVMGANRDRRVLNAKELDEIARGPRVSGQN